MAGIYGVLLKNSNQKEIFKSFYNADFSDVIREEIVYNKFRFGRSVLNKFQKDRFLFENEEFILCFEGINYSEIRSPESLIEEYKIRGKDFVADLKGSFSGFIFSKKSEEILIFNDILSTRVLYYYFDPEQGFAFSSEMHVLSKILRASGISLNYDYDGIYAVALYGQSFYNFTTVKEIKRLNYGSTLIYDPVRGKCKESSYFKFKREEGKLTLPEVIEEMDRLLVDAVKEEWEKDTTNNYEHFGLISGGMDSRVNLMLAKSLGFERINTYTYGDPESSDIKIAQQIAKEHFYSHGQFNLFNGKIFIENTLDRYVRGTDGLTYFTANAVIYNAFKPVNFQQYGLVHSGQLGDTATGSFIKPNFDFEANLDKIGVTGFVKQKELLPKIPFLKNIVQQYNHSDNDEFTYEQRQVNGTLMGDKLFNNFIDIASPFYDRAFLELMLKTPTNFKINQQIYFEWLKVKHPEITNYKWDKIGLKPNSAFNIKYGRLAKRYINGGKKYMGLPYDSMSPVNTWLKTDPTILDHFDRLFNENIELIKDAELRTDLTQIYGDDTFEFRNRFSVLTVLLGIKMHFYEV
jgi:asparagine synthase (glutamine-hydrolysing)